MQSIQDIFHQIQVRKSSPEEKHMYTIDVSNWQEEAYIIRSHLDTYQNGGSDGLPDSWEIQSRTTVKKYSQ